MMEKVMKVLDGAVEDLAAAGQETQEEDLRPWLTEYKATICQRIFNVLEQEEGQEDAEFERYPYFESIEVHEERFYEYEGREVEFDRESKKWVLVKEEPEAPEIV